MFFFSFFRKKVPNHSLNTIELKSSVDYLAPFFGNWKNGMRLSHLYIPIVKPKSVKLTNIDLNNSKNFNLLIQI